MRTISKTRSKRRTGSNSAEQVARDILRDEFSLFSGYPTDIVKQHGTFEIVWQPARHNVFEFTPSIPKTVAITPQRLRRLMTSLDRLRNECRSNLGSCLKRPKHWLRQQRVVIGLLDQVLESGNESTDRLLPLLPLRFTRDAQCLQRYYPSIKQLVDRAIWIKATGSHKDADSTLAWLDKNIDLLHQIQTASRLTAAQKTRLTDIVFSLRADLSPDLLKVILFAATTPQFHRTEKISIDYLETLFDLASKAYSHAYRSFEIPTSSVKSIFERLLCYLEALTEFKRSDRRACLAFLAQVITTTILRRLASGIERLEIAEQEQVRYLRDAKAIFEIQQQGRIKSASIPKSDHEKLFHARFGDSPLPSKEDRHIVSDCRSLLQIIAALEKVEVRHGKLALQGLPLKIWTGALAVFPNEANDFILRVAAMWINMLGDNRRRQRSMKFALDEFRRVVQMIGSCPPAVCKYFRETSRDGVDAIQLVALNSDKTEQSARRFIQFVFQAVIKNHGHPRFATIQYHAWTLLDEAPIDDAVEIINRLVQRGRYNCQQLSFIIAWSYSLLKNTEATIRLCELLGKRGFDDEIAEQMVELAAIRGIGPVFERMLASILIGNRKNSLETIMKLAILATKSDVKLPRLPSLITESPGWIANYPKTLELPLRSLCHVEPNAKEAAQKILNKNFPDKEKVRRELVVLSKKLEALPSGPADDEIHIQVQQARIRSRVNSLRQRLEQPTPTVSEKRMANLADRLAQRAELSFVERFRQFVQAQCAKSSKATWLQLPAAAFKEPYLELTCGISSVEQPHRDIGAKLLSNVITGSPSNYNQHPANVKFCREMQQLGIDLSVWTASEESDDALAVFGKTAKGEPYRVAFTDDMLDYFLMGKHFDTCLSPSSFNFHNTIANAVDINKRVAYGKTKDGHVVGRCQFTLNDNGQLLTYHQYAHQTEDGFKAAAAEFTELLTRRMKTKWAITGKVSNLVVDDWYDDGAVDPTEDTDEQAKAKAMKKPASQVSLFDWFSNEVNDQARDALYPARLVQRCRPGELIAEIDKLFSSCLGLREAHFLAIADLMLGEPQLEFSARMVVAVRAVEQGVPAAAQRLLKPLSTRNLHRLLRKNYCSPCGDFHNIPTLLKTVQVLNVVNPSTTMRFLRSTRKAGVTDLTERSIDRLEALIATYGLLNRKRRAEALQERIAELQAD